MVFRLGAGIRDAFARVTSAVTRVRDEVLGTARAAGVGIILATITPIPGTRDNGETNTAVLRRLATRHPPLLEGLGGAALASARDGFRGARSTWRSIARDASHGAQVEIARRLRSGLYVTNTTATVARKLRAGRGSTAGVDTGQLADALENARTEVE